VTHAKAGVVVVGSLNVDLAVEVERRPEPGETVLGGVLVERAGGKGANQAVAAARVGARVAMVGRVGEDSRAALLRDALRAAGVDDTAVEATPGAPTGIALITVSPDGENAIVVSPGANGELDADDVSRHGELLLRADVVVCQLEIRLEVVEAVAGGLGSAQLVLNAAPALALPAALLDRTDVLVVNAQELWTVAEAAGVPASTEQDAVVGLLEAGPRAVLATLGADGALLGCEGRCLEIPTPHVEVVDTTGAGDATVGALAAAMAAGFEPEPAAGVAVAAGTAAVTAPGPQPPLPDLAALEAAALGARTL
jgi:ribokinase